VSELRPILWVVLPLLSVAACADGARSPGASGDILLGLSGRKLEQDYDNRQILKLCIKSADKLRRRERIINCRVQYVVQIDDPDCQKDIYRGETRSGMIEELLPPGCDKKSFDVNGRIIPPIGCCDPDAVELENIKNTADNRTSCNLDNTIYVNCFADLRYCR
jgi:hypothetical protein